MFRSESMFRLESMFILSRCLHNNWGERSETSTRSWTATFLYIYIYIYLFIISLSASERAQSLFMSIEISDICGRTSNHMRMLNNSSLGNDIK